jgi:hypothetical protein
MKIVQYYFRPVYTITEEKMKTSKLLVIAVSACFVFLLASGCAHQPPPSSRDLPGFWKGLVHGFIAPVSFIISLFSHNRIYEFPNAGLWYDFGFMLGIGGFSGGIFGASRKGCRKK